MKLYQSETEHSQHCNPLDLGAEHRHSSRNFPRSYRAISALRSWPPPGKPLLILALRISLRAASGRICDWHDAISFSLWKWFCEDTLAKKADSDCNCQFVVHSVPAQKTSTWQPILHQMTHPGDRYGGDLSVCCVREVVSLCHSRFSASLHEIEKGQKKFLKYEVEPFDFYSLREALIVVKRRGTWSTHRSRSSVRKHLFKEHGDLGKSNARSSFSARPLRVCWFSPTLLRLSFGDMKKGVMHLCSSCTSLHNSVQICAFVQAILEGKKGTDTHQIAQKRARTHKRTKLHRRMQYPLWLYLC